MTDTNETSVTESKRRVRGTGQIRARGGHWQLRYYNGRGVRIEERTDFPADEAGRKKADKLLRKRTGAVDNGIVLDSRSLRYEDIRDDYLEQLDLDTAKSLRHDADGTPYLEAVRRLDPFFEGYRCVEIGVDAIGAYKRKQREAGLSGPTINRSLACLRRMFSLAQENERLVAAPFIRMNRESKPRTGTLPHEQYKPPRRCLPTCARC